MASSFSAFLGGVATVAVALGIGFGGGLYLTDTSLMNNSVGGKTSKQDQAKPARASAPESVASSSQTDQLTPKAPAAPVSAMEKGPPQSAAAEEARVVTQQAAAPATTAAPVPPANTRAAAQPPSPPRQAAAPTPGDADRAPVSGPPFARIPDDAHATATANDEELAKESTAVQRRKAVAAQKAEQQRKAERRRLERAERVAADNEMKAAIAARDRARFRYDQDDNDEPRGFIGFASGRDPDRRPSFFGIPLFGN